MGDDGPEYIESYLDVRFQPAENGYYYDSLAGVWKKAHHSAIKTLRPRRHTTRSFRGRVIAFYSNNCYMCTNPQQLMMTIDHIIPVSLGGTNEIENLIPACYGCNQKKGHSLDPRYRALAKMAMGSAILQGKDLM